MQLDDRNLSSSNYRFGFNGKENDPEVAGQQDYGFRIYDRRLARFKSVDPLTMSYPWNCTFAFSENSPIVNIDLDGKERYHYKRTWENGKPILTPTHTEDFKEKVWSPHFSSATSFSFTKEVINPREEYVVHEEREGTIEYFDKVQFVVYDETWTYNSYDYMVNNYQGKYGGEHFQHLAKKGLANVAEESKAQPGGGLNWSKAFKRFGIKDYIPNSKNFLSSANKSWGNGLSEVGRALQKHAGRAGSVFENVKFSGKTANADGMKILEEIMGSKNQIIKAAKRGGYEVYDEVSGQGFAISRNGEFNGFRELTKKK